MDPGIIEHVLALGMSIQKGVQEQLPVGEDLTSEKVNGFSATGLGNLSSNGNTEILAKVDNNDGAIAASIELVPDGSNSIAESVDLNLSKVLELKEADQLKSLKQKVHRKSKNEKPSNIKAATVIVKKVNDRKGVAPNPSNGSLALNSALKRCSAKEKSQTIKGKQVIDSNANPSSAVNSACIAKSGKSGPASCTLLSTKSDGQTKKTKLKPLGNASINRAEENTEANSPTTADAKSLRVGALPSYNFSFKCNERAEKRREFYSILEEKIHAKEAEKSNLQAKSKECQEAELKMLRKSLTFKATPMPSFYQEPPPPKADLKKIPTTRAKSPKFGRKKGSPTRDSDDDGGLGHQNVCISFDERSLQNDANKGPPTYVKKPHRKSLPKLPSEKTNLSQEANEATCKKKALPTDEIYLNEKMRDITISAKIGLKESDNDDMIIVEDNCLVALVQEPISLEN